MFVSGQKNIFLNIEFFDVSNEIKKLLKFLTLEKTGVKKTRGKKRILDPRIPWVLLDPSGFQDPKESAFPPRLFHLSKSHFQHGIHLIH